MAILDTSRVTVKVGVEKTSYPALPPEDVKLVDETVENSAEGVDSAYEQKSHLSKLHPHSSAIHASTLCLPVNQCLQHEIGFGRYQWELFILTGFGWLADSEPIR